MCLWRTRVPAWKNQLVEKLQEYHQHHHPYIDSTTMLSDIYCNLHCILYLWHVSNGLAKTEYILVHSPHVPITRRAKTVSCKMKVGCVVSVCLLIHVRCMHPELYHTCVWPTTSHEHWLSQKGRQKFFGENCMSTRWTAILSVVCVVCLTIILFLLTFPYWPR